MCENKTKLTNKRGVQWAVGNPACTVTEYNGIWRSGDWSDVLWERNGGNYHSNVCTLKGKQEGMKDEVGVVVGHTKRK